MANNDGPASNIQDRKEDRARLDAFLLAEYGHVSEALLRNEESGDKRASFFVSVAGAAAAVLAFTFGGESPIVERALVPHAAATSATLLLIFGLLTLRRIIERHIVTDCHIFALRSLRRGFVSREAIKEFPNAFFNPYKAHKPRKMRVFSLGKGGWLQTVALINSTFAGIAVAAAIQVVSPTYFWWWSALGALVAFAGAWSWQLTYARVKLADEVAKLMICEPSDVTSN